MEKLDFKKIDNYIHRYARELDLAIWNCLFNKGSPVDVANSLLYYQNEDVGFGKGLDPDNWNANSLAYACHYAIETLEVVNFFDMNHPVYKGIKKYLERTSIENWDFTIPTNKDFPHASFYNYSKEYNQIQNLGVVIFLCSFVLEYMQDSSVYETVKSKLDFFVNKLSTNDLGDMGPSGYIKLIDTMKKQNIPGYDYEKLSIILSDIVNKNMQKDETQWSGYGYRPSDFIKSKNSLFLIGNEDIVQKECEFYIRTLPQNDIWPVSWCWFENAKLYLKEEVIALHIAKVRKCIEHVQFLNEFDFVQF